MARRKQTTESPANIPMKTESMRKKRSSRKAACKAWRAAARRLQGLDVSDSDREEARARAHRSSINSSPVAGDEQQGEVGAFGRSTVFFGLLLDAKNQIHGLVGKVGFKLPVHVAQFWLHSRPFRFERSEIVGGRRPVKVDSARQDTFIQALTREVESGTDAAISFGVGDPATVWIRSQYEIRGVEQRFCRGFGGGIRGGGVQKSLGGAVTS